MIRSTLIGLVAVLGLAVSTSAQFVPFPFPVTCSGCPNATTLENSGFSGGNTSMVINTSVAVRAAFPAAAAADVRAVVLYMGYNTGNCSIDYSGLVPFQNGGPCNWSIVPMFGEADLGTFLNVAAGDSVTATLRVPNDRSLHQQGFGFQALRVNFTTALWNMSKSHTGVVSIF